MHVNLDRRGEGQETAAPAIDFAAGRRALMKCLGLGALGATMLGTLGSESADAQAANNDVDIFNFALNLEYLEAEFYLRATTGKGLEAGDIEGTGTQGTVSGGRAVAFVDPTIRNLAAELASDELAHVRLLRGILGSSKIARPAIDLSQAFNIAASFAGLGNTFDPFANDANFLLASFLFEDVGVSAYQGAAPLITDPRNLSGAARIMAVEGYHAGAIRMLLYANGIYQAPQQISDARDNFDGSTDLDQGIGVRATSNVVPADAGGVAFPRTTSQVLSIVYLNGNAQPTGFFPNGFNGNIR